MKCVQCEEELKRLCKLSSEILYFCDNPACANYSLVSVGLLPEEDVS